MQEHMPSMPSEKEKIQKEIARLEQERATNGSVAFDYLEKGIGDKMAFEHAQRETDRLQREIDKLQHKLKKL
jgi:hypothetical protein